MTQKKVFFVNYYDPIMKIPEKIDEWIIKVEISWKIFGKNDLDLLCREHQVMDEVYEFFGDK